MSEARSYRFGDASRPGLLLGLSGRQAIPLVAGIVSLAVVLQTPLPPLAGLLGPLVGFGMAFGRWRGLPIAETATPAWRLLARRLTGKRRWVRPSLIGDNSMAALPVPLRELELLEPAGWPVGVVRDRAAGSVTALVRVHGYGFPLAAAVEQDQMLAGWGAALSPFAREGSPVRQLVWQEWAHAVTSDTHRGFLDGAGTTRRGTDRVVADYLRLVDAQAPTSIAHDVLVGVTVDERRVRARRSSRSRLAAAVDALADELRLFTARLEAAGLAVDGPLSALEVSAAARTRSDPGRAAQVATLSRSLAAAARRGALEWGPMVVEPAWGHCRVDGAVHRSYHVAGWPRLPVGADWLSGLLADTHCVRTVTVVMEPVPMGRAARAADREVMAREADSELKERKGFRVNARERKRLSDAERRERELSEGHAEFAFVGLVTVTASSLDELDDDCAQIEQAAAQCLLDLRPLDARHDQGWVASLPFGRALAPRVAP
ncbi:MAG: SCO6880 family protein [Ilumatobacteraceae bacterium]